jgi:histidinol dehydrogenase
MQLSKPFIISCLNFYLCVKKINGSSLMKIYKYPSASAQKRIAVIANRELGFKKKEVTAVTRILEDVKKNGDTALIKYATRFDSPGMTIDALKVTRKEIDAASKQVDKNFRHALDKAIANIDSFHRRQQSQSWITTDESGAVLGQLVNPVDAAGIYVPGGQSGQTPLVSSVLMGAIPARIAGVQRMVMVTPPTGQGIINPCLLTAAAKVGITEIYKIGSAWAIAALAYGTDTIGKVDVIAGPGNIYVTLAKKMLAGRVGIDMIAGPSEVLIIADQNADPEFIAADLLSQAEHDPLASAILVTDSVSVARATSQALDRQIKKLSRQEIAKKSLINFGALLVVPDMATAVTIANKIAPEHLELQVDDPFAYLGRIRNAGALFLGRYTPEAVGDYIAGPNHVLPTAGTARFSSALSVSHFTKKTSLIHYPKAAFDRDARDIMCLANTEGLGAHANSIAIRTEK